MKNKIENLTNQTYISKYDKECKYIWKTYVPQKGKALVLEGELLRELEKLRWEAQNNGNINWNDDLSFYCENIKETLTKMDLYSETEKENITLIMDYLKSCGEYAQKFYARQEELEIENIAYVEDTLYDMVADAIGYIQVVKNKKRKTNFLKSRIHILLIIMSTIFLTIGIGGLIVTGKAEDYEDKGVYTFFPYDLEIDEVNPHITGRFGRRQMLEKDYYVIYKTDSEKDYEYRNKVNSEWEAAKKIQDNIPLVKRVLISGKDTIVIDKNSTLQTYLSNQRTKYFLLSIIPFVYITAMASLLIVKIFKNKSVMLNKKEWYMLIGNSSVILGILLIFVAFENVIAFAIRALSNIWNIRLNYLDFYSSSFRIFLSFFGLLLILFGAYLNKKST